MTKEEIFSHIDHTLLRADCTEKEIDALCAEAVKYNTASVCIPACHIAHVRAKFPSLNICTVIGFPLGQNTPTTILFETLEAIENGADELDFVLNVAQLKVAAAKGEESREYEELLDEWSVIKRAVEETKAEAVTKLIIECCYLTDEEKVVACKLAKAAGFDFVKTSTGFGTGGATVADVKLMRKTVGKKMGVKAAGGIRTKADAEAMIAAGATRLGCSAGVAIVA